MDSWCDVVIPGHHIVPIRPAQTQICRRERIITIEGEGGVGEGGRMKAKADTQRRIDKRTAKKKRRILPDEVRTLGKV